MILLLTGTPGTGKSTVAKLFAEKYNFKRISINEVATSEVCVGVEGGTKIVDIEKLSEKIRGLTEEDTIIEGHLSHYLPVGDITIVLRTKPDILEKRLLEKGFGEEKIRENLEAEALDVCLIESLERKGNVYEIDTTDKSPEEVVSAIKDILDGNKDKFLPGRIDWAEEFF
jgi:adenylate kinase